MNKILNTMITKQLEKVNGQDPLSIYNLLVERFSNEENSLLNTYNKENTKEIIKKSIGISWKYFIRDIGFNYSQIDNYNILGLFVNYINDNFLLRSVFTDSKIGRVEWEYAEYIQYNLYNKKLYLKTSPIIKEVDNGEFCNIISEPMSDIKKALMFFDEHIYKTNINKLLSNKKDIQYPKPMVDINIMIYNKIIKPLIDKSFRRFNIDKKRYKVRIHHKLDTKRDGDGELHLLTIVTIKFLKSHKRFRIKIDTERFDVESHETFDSTFDDNLFEQDLSWVDYSSRSVLSYGFFESGYASKIEEE